MHSFADFLAEDIARKINAGARLTYALYHAPLDWWKHEHPQGLLKAYMAAQDAYGLHHPRP